jgi:integrase
VAEKVNTGRSRGHTRRRGGSYQVLVYAGLDPLTGKEIRLTGSAGTESEAKAILRRLRAQVDEERAPKTKASFRAAMDTWLRILDVQESTREATSSTPLCGCRVPGA